MEKDKKGKKGLKCYTKKAPISGKMYTTCNADAQQEKPKKKVKRLVLKTRPKKSVEGQRPPPPPPPTEKPKKKRLVLKVRPKPVEKPKPKPKPANYDMLRPEIRKNILEFAGAKTPIDKARDELIDLTSDSYRGLDATYVFFVINNTLDKIGSRNLGELNIETTFKRTPRARTIFLRNPIEVLKEYRKRTGEVKYKNVIERSLSRVKVYKKIMENATAKEADKEYKPTSEDEAITMKAVIAQATSQNLLKNDFYPAAVKQVKKGGWVKNTLLGVKREMISNYRTDGIIDYIDGGLRFGLSSFTHLLVVMERLYINAKSESAFTTLMKMMNSGLVKRMKEAIIKNREKWDRKDAYRKKQQENRDEIQKKREELKRMKEELDAFENSNR